MSNLENLLRRYHEGGLTPEEMDELNQLTHRDQVFSSACRQAKAIRRRQVSVVCGVAAVLLVTGVVFLARPTVDADLSDAPIVAQTDVPKPTEPITEMPSDNALPKTPTTEVSSSQNTQHDTAVLLPKPSLITPQAVEQPASVETIVEHQQPTIVTDDPIVACNTQCSPDSVINDIWKFLRT